MEPIPSYLLNLAGEYRVCSELAKRGVFATVTYGNHKGVDVYAISDKKDLALRIEVKTSQRQNFVTSITQKGLETDERAPDFWVLYQVRVFDDKPHFERFFVLSHAEICRVQSQRNDVYVSRFFARHGKKPDLSRGVDNVKVNDVERFENRWDKIVARFELSPKASARRV